MINIKLNEDGSRELEGNFEFKHGRLLYDPYKLSPTVEIKFEWYPEIRQDLINLKNNEYPYELIGNKLKEDFISFLKIGEYK